MSDVSTTRMIEMYNETADAPLFLAGFFQSPPRNFHDGEKVEIDVIRDDEDVAIVIQDVSVGPRSNEANVYTNKAFTPPIYDEKGPITAYNLFDRRAGQIPFDDPDFGANATFEAFNIFQKLERKIRRAIELQASQVLQTGKLTLTDQDGSTLYDLDFLPKSTHFVFAETEWSEDGATGNPLLDLETLATTVRRDGKKKPNKLIFGAGAARRFLANTEVKERLDNRRFELGRIAPEVRGEGANFLGEVWIGHYLFEIWMYDGYFRAPGQGAYTPYVTDLKVIMLSEGGRLDLSFGSIPSFATADDQALSFLPSRITSIERGMALSVNSWFTPDKKTLFVSAGTRPLTIPTAIDTFGCLTVTTS